MYVCVAENVELLVFFTFFFYAPFPKKFKPNVGLAGFCTDFDFAGIWNQAIFVTNREKFITCFRMFQHCRPLHDVVVISSVS